MKGSTSPLGKSGPRTACAWPRTPFTLLLLAACATARGDAADPADPPLAGVKTWAIQLQGVEKIGARAKLAASKGDLLVVDPTRTVRGREWYDARGLVTYLHAARKRVLAYANVGQAEEYRTYWAPDWRAPTKEAPGEPAFLLTVDPDGWAGNYPVAYWNPAWRAILFRMVDEVLADGFDGLYCDWVLGYHEPAVAAAAKSAGIDPARVMAELLRDLRARAREKNPRFAVVAQNAAYLSDAVPELYGWVDGVAQEDLSFSGAAGVAWDDPKSGDLPRPREGEDSRAALTRQLEQWHRRGLPVLTLDYALETANADEARRFSRGKGFLPFVSRTPLDRLPD
ncbi:MAG: endo alpha-1,4 polygalactosaminidase [Planctomycetaceae bacterium]